MLLNRRSLEGSAPARIYTGAVGSKTQRSLQWAAAAAAVIAILFLAFGLVAGSGR